MFQSPRPYIAAAVATLALSACNGEPAPQISLDGPDSAACTALLAQPQNQACDLLIEFGPVSPQAGPTRRAAVEAWLAAHPGPVVQTREGGQGSAQLCLTVPLERDTDGTFDGLKPIGSTSAAGLMRMCSDTGHSLVASDPVDHGGDEVKR